MSKLVNPLKSFFTTNCRYQECRECTETEIPVLCIANKIDFDPEAVSKKFAFASRHNLPFFYVSAADGTNVVRIFGEAIAL